jgi:hypothetical protein
MATNDIFRCVIFIVVFPTHQLRRANQLHPIEFPQLRHL